VLTSAGLPPKRRRPPGAAIDSVGAGIGRGMALVLLLDLSSINGTRVNPATTNIPIGRAIPLMGGRPVLGRTAR
jgi:hypothetical protein